MFGINSFITARNIYTSVEMERFLTSITNAIVHRGPDHGRSWSDTLASVWLVHRRLVIEHQLMPLRKLAAKRIISISPQTWNIIASAFLCFIPKTFRLDNFGDKLHKGAGVLSSQSADKLCLGLISHWYDQGSLAIGDQEKPSGPLSDWAENLLSPERHKHEGFINDIPMHKKWTEHLSGLLNWQHQLCDVLIFQAWLESNK